MAHQHERTLIVDDELAIVDEPEAISVHMLNDPRSSRTMLGSELLSLEKQYPPETTGDGQGRQFYSDQPKIVMQDPDMVPRWIRKEIGRLGYDIVANPDAKFEAGQPVDEDEAPTVAPGRRTLEDDDVPPTSDRQRSPASGPDGSPFADDLEERTPGVSTIQDRDTGSSSTDTTAESTTDQETAVRPDDAGSATETQPDAQADTNTDTQADTNTASESDEPVDVDPEAGTDVTPDRQPTLSEIADYEADRLDDDFNLTDIEGIGANKKGELLSEGIETVAQLQLMTVDQLASIDGFGEKKAEDIKQQVGTVDPDDLDGFEFNRTPKAV